MGLEITGRYRYPPPASPWLALREESILEPALPIIDAHHHIWEEGGHPYLLDQLGADLQSGHAIRATVAVEAHYGYRTDGPAALRSVGETDRLDAVARAATASGASTAICAAIVSAVNLCDGSTLETALDAHQASAPTRFRGVRHSVVRDPHFPQGIGVRPAPANLLADPAYRAGMAMLARRNLSYEAMLYHVQIPELTRAAQAVPDLRIVLNHFGCILGVGPYAGKEHLTFAAWRRDIAELARCDNVSVKLGGLGMIVCGAEWHLRPYPPGSVELAQTWRPYVETCIERFGAERCMFESNFPVDKAMYSYAVLWNAFKRIASAASADEKSALFSDTAARFYRIATA